MNSSGGGVGSTPTSSVNHSRIPFDPRYKNATNKSRAELRPYEHFSITEGASTVHAIAALLRFEMSHQRRHVNRSEPSLQSVGVSYAIGKWLESGQIIKDEVDHSLGNRFECVLRMELKRTLSRSITSRMALSFLSCSSRNGTYLSATNFRS